MQKMKRNHWVSQAYLRGFAADADTRKKIWRFSKSGGDPELKPIEKVAVKFHLYAPRDATGKRDYSFEQRLSRLEQWFGHPMWHKLCNEMAPLETETMRKFVSLLTAVMYLRNPAEFERAKHMHRQIVDIYSQLPELPTVLEHNGKEYKVDTSKWTEYRDASEDDLKRYWIENVSLAGWLAEKLMKMRWAVVFSETPVFITTDQPVTIVHPDLCFRGLDNPETCILFPLSPTRVLMMDNRHGEPDGHYFPLKTGPASFNMTMWRNASEHMYSHRDTDFVCAEMLEEAERLGYAG